MTEQITVKLNRKLFRPLLDELSAFSGKSLDASDSSHAAKSLFFFFFLTQVKQRPSGKTANETFLELKKTDSAKFILDFLGEYAKFKKLGLEQYKRTLSKNNKK